MPSSTFTVDSLPDLQGRVYLVTGGNAGIGKATVIGLASRGARVYMGARTESKALECIKEIKTELPSASVQFLSLDLSSLESVVTAAKTLRGRENVLHGLINNAGVMGVPFSKTADDYEIQFQTNYLSHWLLTFHLLPLLSSTAASSPEGTVRVVNVTSDGHAMLAPKTGINFDDLSLENESAMTRYGQSKLANVLHAKQLHLLYGPGSEQAKANNRNIIFSAVHPGHIDTDLNRQATGTAPGPILRVMVPLMKCLGILDAQEKGAWSSLFAIASDNFKSSDSGAYIIPYAKIGTPSKFATDAVLAHRLWDWTDSQLRAKGLLELGSS
ncbi:putative oxidoreductase [Cladobotryum mycophilum]|uniref:Oxidoreductase n=1 Tax=Cladobotryum mycophilum TaxID=491253 RepID=A0ABR0T4Q2_9HYPO